MWPWPLSRRPESCAWHVVWQCYTFVPFYLKIHPRIIKIWTGHVNADRPIDRWQTVRTLYASLRGHKDDNYSWQCHGNNSSAWNWILWPTLKELDARNIHTKFYQIWPSGLRGEVILMKKFTDGHHSITISHHELKIVSNH